MWNTTGFSLGNYTISAYASQVSEEMDIEDNNYVDGVVKVKLPVHDVAVTDVIPSKTVVGKGYSVSINVTVENQGDYTETFNVTISINQTKTVTLPPNNQVTLVFLWNTTNVLYGNYTIIAYATVGPNETDIIDNTWIDGWVFVTIPGDVDGDGDVDIFDIVIIAGVYGVSKPDPRYDPNNDIDGDGDVDIFDIVAAAGNYNKSW